MTRISSRVLSLSIPIAVSVFSTLVFFLFKKPVLTEIVLALVVVAVLYCVFVFVCLFFNIGIAKEKPFDFSEIPGLTKHHGWFRKVASTDTSASLDLATGADDPLGCLVGALLVILMPLIVAIVVFLVSGGIEVLIFLATYICYYSVVRILRMQLTSRKRAKGNWILSTLYSIFYTATSVGLLPIGLWLYTAFRGLVAF